VVTLLRLGAKPDADAARKALTAAQLPDGGYAAMGTNGDLATSYRVLRALWMLKARPDLDALERFVASCRNADGGYGPAPGQPSNANATYFAAIMLHWTGELRKSARRPAPSPAGSNLGSPRIPNPRPILRPGR